MERQIQSNEIGELGKALAQAQGQMKEAIRDAENPFFKSSYADLGSVWRACREALSKNGLAIIQTTDDEKEGAITLITTLIHLSGQWIKGYLSLRPIKNDPQGVGSALTYARRYALGAMVGIATEEDDDAEGAMDRHHKEKGKAINKNPSNFNEHPPLPTSLPESKDNGKNGAKKSLPEDKHIHTKQEIVQMLLELAEGDKVKAKSLLKIASGYMDRDGKWVELDSLKGNISQVWLNIIYGKVKKMLENRQSPVVPDWDLPEALELMEEETDEAGYPLEAKDDSKDIADILTVIETILKHHPDFETLARGYVLMCGATIPESGIISLPDMVRQLKEEGQTKMLKWLNERLDGFAKEKKEKKDRQNDS